MNRGPALFGLAGCLALAAAAAFAADQAGPRPSGDTASGAPQEQISLSALIAPPLTEREEKLRSEIQPRIARDSQSAVARKTWRFVSPTGAVMLGLEKNLALRLSGRQPLLAREALLEARAVFDPLLQVTVSQAGTVNSVRSVTADITLLTFQQGACQPIPTVSNAATNGKPDVILICFAVPGPTQQLSGPAYATPQNDAKPGLNTSSVMSVGVTQQLPWGPVLQLVDTSTYNKTYYSVDSQYFSYGASWSSNLFASLTVPLPGTKGFGPLAPNDYAIKLAQKGNERAFWDVKTALNSILLQIDLAYLDLVEGAEALAATIENRKIVETLSPSYERMYKQEVISRFDKAQMDAELARVKVDEEVALRRYYSLSTAMVALVEDDPAKIAESILLPAGFTVGAEAMGQPKLDEIHAAALSRRPELKSAEVGLEMSRLTLKFAENQALQDATANFSGTVGQDASTYGYKSLSQSIGHLPRPDDRNRNYTLTFNNPIGRRAALAGIKTASANLGANEYASRVMANTVIEDVNSAYAAYSSAVARVQEAREALKLSDFAYQQVERRFKIGEYVTQVELNRNRRDVLSSRLSLITAQIDVRRAEARLMAAQGVIADRYASTHAFNDFERHRLAMLGASKALKFFNPEVNTKDPGTQ